MVVAAGTNKALQNPESWVGHGHSSAALGDGWLLLEPFHGREGRRPTRTVATGLGYHGRSGSSGLVVCDHPRPPRGPCALLGR